MAITCTDVTMLIYAHSMRLRWAGQSQLTGSMKVWRSRWWSIELEENKDSCSGEDSVQGLEWHKSDTSFLSRKLCQQIQIKQWSSISSYSLLLLSNKVLTQLLLSLAGDVESNPSPSQVYAISVYQSSTPTQTTLTHPNNNRTKKKYVSYKSTSIANTSSLNN